MTTYLLRRLLLLIPTLFGITLLTFFLLRASPINPANLKGAGSAERGHPMTAKQREELLKFYDLDKPAPVAYALWLGKIFHGNLGTSFVDNRPVLGKITERVGLTISIAGSALVLSYLVAIPLGVVAALRRGQLTDRAISFGVFLLYSIPSFVVALLLILYVAGGDYLDLLPMYGANSINASSLGNGAWLVDRLTHMILPVACLSYASLASISRYSRVSMLDALGQDFVRTARAKGLNERLVIFRHALRNALIPVITIFAQELPFIIGGSIIIEQIFTLPGMGQLLFLSLNAGDYPMVMGITLLIAVVTLLGYLAADILYVAVDPRITFE